MKKFIPITLLLALGCAGLTGCTAGVEQEATHWKQTVEQQTGVANVTLKPTTPLPFTYNPGFAVDISPAGENYENIAKVMCETSPDIDLNTPVFITITQPNTATLIKFEDTGKCPKLVGAYGATWEALNQVLPEAALEINPSNPANIEYGLTTVEVETVDQINIFLEKNTPNFPDLFSLTTTGSVRNIPGRTFDIKFDGTREEFSDFVQVLKLVADSNDPIVEMGLQDGIITVVYGFGVTYETVEGYETELKSRVTTVEVDAKTSAEVNPNVSEEQLKLADLMGVEYKNRNLQIKATSSAISLTTDDLGLVLEATSFLQQNNTILTPVVVHYTGGEKIKFNGAFKVSGDVNQFKTMVEDAEQFDSNLIDLVWFEGTHGVVRVKDDFPPGSTEYETVKKVAQKIVKQNPSYGKFTVEQNNVKEEIIN